MKRTPLTRYLGLRVGLLLAFVAFALFAPTVMGGRVTYVTTFGISMRPHIHAGDLVLVRPAGDYKVGDVVAYRSATLGGVTVLHRIVARHGDKFTFKGDNNSW